MLLDPVHQNMLTETLHIFTKEEVEARFHVLTERYAKDLLIEANTLRSMLFTAILPTAYEYRGTLAQTVVNLKNAGVGAEPETAVLKKVGQYAAELQAAGEKLIAAIAEASNAHEDEDVVAANHLLPVMQLIRKTVDELEQVVADKDWPFPKYTELLFSI